MTWLRYGGLILGTFLIAVACVLVGLAMVGAEIGQGVLP